MFLQDEGTTTPADDTMPTAGGDDMGTDAGTETAAPAEGGDTASM